MKYKILLIVFLISKIYSVHSLEWQIYKTTDLIIHYSAKDKEIAKDIGDNLQIRIDEFQMRLGVYPSKRAKIYLAPDSDQYDKWVSNKKGIIEHSNAFYSNKNKSIFIRPISESKIFTNRIIILLHEYIHFVVHLYWHKPLLWFDEGMAVYFSEGIAFSREIKLVKDQLIHIRRPLKKMYSYPKNRIYWDSFYTKSAKGVAKLFNSDQERFHEFWDQAQENKDFRKGFFLAFDETPEDFSNRFEAKFRKSLKLKALLLSLGFTWSILPFLLLIVWYVKKIKNKVILRKWEDE